MYHSVCVNAYVLSSCFLKGQPPLSFIYWWLDQQIAGWWIKIMLWERVEQQLGQV